MCISGGNVNMIYNINLFFFNFYNNYFINEKKMNNEK